MILRGDIMDKTLQLLKELCSHCESNLNECNKGCAWRSLSNEYCEEYEKLKEGIEKLKEKHNEKMLLVIDKPNECSECPCFYDYLRCQAEEDAKVYGEKRPYNCPLKPVHSLKSGGKDYIIYERQFLYDNLDREIEMMKKGKEIYESNISV